MSCLAKACGNKFAAVVPAMAAHRFPVARVVEVAVLKGGRSPEVIEAGVLS